MATFPGLDDILDEEFLEVARVFPRLDVSLHEQLLEVAREFEEYGNLSRRPEPQFFINVIQGLNLLPGDNVQDRIDAFLSPLIPNLSLNRYDQIMNILGTVFPNYREQIEQNRLLVSGGRLAMGDLQRRANEAARRLGPDHPFSQFWRMTRNYATSIKDRVYTNASPKKKVGLLAAGVGASYLISSSLRQKVNELTQEGLDSAYEWGGTIKDRVIEGALMFVDEISRMDTTNAERVIKDIYKDVAGNTSFIYQAVIDVHNAFERQARNIANGFIYLSGTGSIEDAINEDIKNATSGELVPVEKIKKDDSNIFHSSLIDEFVKDITKESRIPHIPLTRSLVDNVPFPGGLPPAFPMIGSSVDTIPPYSQTLPPGHSSGFIGPYEFGFNGPLPEYHDIASEPDVPSEPREPVTHLNERAVSNIAANMMIYYKKRLDAVKRNMPSALYGNTEYAIISRVVRPNLRANPRYTYVENSPQSVLGRKPPRTR